MMWRLTYDPGTVKAIVWRRNEVLSEEIKTAGMPAKIILEPDRKAITADCKGISFAMVKILDEKGTMVPNIHNLMHFKISGEGKIVGVDNGSETDLDSFKADSIKTFHGLALVIVQFTGETGEIKIISTSDGLEESVITIKTKN